MTTQVGIALIAAAASLAVALFSAWRTGRTQHRLAELTDRLQEQRAERDARRDYEYDAKKRLYAECEPVLFEAMELAETFRRRVLSLARAAANGGLHPDGTGWLAGHGYYLRSTAYYLLAPATSVKVLQRRLTAVDLGLEPRIAFQYQLLKEIFHSYTWDHDLARAAPPLPYHPDAGDGHADRRQGLYLGVLDQIADALATPTHCRSLGEFWTDFDDPAGRLGPLRGEVTELIGGFHPAAAPVLWRVLVSQYQLFGALLRTRDDRAVLLPSADEVIAEGLDWRPAGASGPPGEVRTAIEAGRDYVSRRLDYLKQL